MDLEPLLAYHPLWGVFKQILLHGDTFPLRPISTEERSMDLHFHSKRRNQKSADKLGEALKKRIESDVSHGFTLPLPRELLFSIPNASLAPLGCLDQDTINERGERSKKFRMTHDQSFLGTSLHSVNERVIKEDLPHYSFTLLRLLHCIISLRQRHPTTSILMSKFDLDSANHHCHLSGETSHESLAIHNDTLFIALWLTFGGSPCPAMWGIVSEIITDTCNTLLHCEAWNHLDFYCQTPSLLHDNIAVTVNLKDNPLRIIRAIPLAIHSIARPVDPNDDLPRVDIISSKKLKAEGTLEEIKTVLGWVINTRHLLISLPPDKHKKWSSDITKIIHSNKVSHTQLEPLIRRLNHVAGIIPMFRHFLGRLTQALYFSTKHKRTNLSIPELSDLHLSVKFLDMSAAGVSINNIAFQKPTSFYRSDSSEFGLGGYNIISGRAWRFEIPYHLCLCTSLNSLEFLACFTQFGSISQKIGSVQRNVLKGFFRTESSLTSMTLLTSIKCSSPPLNH
jgi:hypothetical protein